MNRAMCSQHVGRVVARAASGRGRSGCDRPSMIRTASTSAGLSGSSGKTAAGLSVMLMLWAPAERSARAARPWPSSRWCTAAKAAAGSCDAGRVHAAAVAQVGRAPRLVERGPGADPVAEAGVHDLGVLGEGLGGLPVGPAAPVLQGLRQVPVVERDDRVDALAEQLVGQPVVEVQAAGVDRAGAVGLDPRPGDREPVRRRGRGRPSAPRRRRSGGSGRRRRRRCARRRPCPAYG